MSRKENVRPDILANDGRYHKFKDIGRVALGATLALMLFAPGHLQAQMTNVVTITTTAKMQGVTNDNGTVSTIAPPAKRTMDTKQILEFLAQDENAAGRYASTNFPAGAKLMVGSTTGDMQVWDANNTFLVDVTNVLTISRGTNVVVNGKINDSTGLYNRTYVLEYILKLTYNDTAIGGGAGLEFYLAGLTTKTDNETAPNKSGIYSETILNEMPNGTGDGSLNSVPFVITGSTTITGRSTNTISQ